MFWTALLGRLFTFFVAWALVVSVQPTRAADAALERTRTQVRMLDDLYKAAVVLITTHYVNDKSSLPAGTAAVTLFEAMKKKGWHEVRLLDATGTPLFARNLPQDEFESRARRCCTIQTQRESGRFPKPSFTTPRRRTSACRTRPSVRSQT